MRESNYFILKDDPFVLKGVVRNWIIREWHESEAEL